MPSLSETSPVSVPVLVSAKGREKIAMMTAYDAAFARLVDHARKFFCIVVEKEKIGIDNLEHGFFAATDSVADKQPDACPGQARGQQQRDEADAAAPARPAPPRGKGRGACRSSGLSARRAVSW